MLQDSGYSGPSFQPAASLAVLEFREENELAHQIAKHVQAKAQTLSFVIPKLVQNGHSGVSFQCVLKPAGLEHPLDRERVAIHLVIVLVKAQTLSFVIPKLVQNGHSGVSFLPVLKPAGLEYPLESEPVVTRLETVLVKAQNFWSATHRAALSGPNGANFQVAQNLVDQVSLLYNFLSSSLKLLLKSSSCWSSLCETVYQSSLKVKHNKALHSGRFLPFPQP
jgi:hypothetical protein